MTPEHSATLRAQFPKLYAGIKYFEVGDGWFDLLMRLSEAIDGRASCVQCKEKFGGLRYYAEDMRPGVQDIISIAERDSFTICELCGLPGTRRMSNGWLHTRCGSC